MAIIDNITNIPINIYNGVGKSTVFSAVKQQTEIIKLIIKIKNNTFITI